MVDRQGEVGEIRLADGFAVVVGLNRGKKGQVLLDSVRDAIQGAGALGHRGATPLVSRSMRSIERELNVFRLRAGDLTDYLSGRGRDVVEVTSLDGRDPFSPDEILIARV